MYILLSNYFYWAVMVKLSVNPIARKTYVLSFAVSENEEHIQHSQKLIFSPRLCQPNKIKM
jgi:hypothetical protein